MSKKYDRELKEVERLILENRELKSQVRQLSRQIKKLNKGYHRIEELEEEARYDEIKEIVVDTVRKICYTCNIGVLEYIDLEARYYRQCNNCDYHTRTKPKE